MPEPTIAAIHIARAAGAPLAPLDHVRAVPARGLEGDRYFAGAGTFSKGGRPDQQVTLIEAEALADLERDYGIGLAPGASRRNLTTRGIPLNHLVGRTFRAGGATLRGIELCEPCGHLERLTQPGVKKGLIHRGGLRAEIVSEGVIRVGDPLQTD
ncbi:MAG: MOSC domain-containing protein [Gemmatimonadota bacterium]